MMRASEARNLTEEYKTKIVEKDTEYLISFINKKIKKSIKKGKFSVTIHRDDFYELPHQKAKINATRHFTSLGYKISIGIYYGEYLTISWRGDEQDEQ